MWLIVVVFSAFLFLEDVEGKYEQTVNIGPKVPTNLEMCDRLWYPFFILGVLCSLRRVGTSKGGWLMC